MLESQILFVGVISSIYVHFTKSTFQFVDSWMNGGWSRSLFQLHFDQGPKVNRLILPQKTTSSPLKVGHPKGNFKISNHPFSGGFSFKTKWDFKKKYFWVCLPAAPWQLLLWSNDPTVDIQARVAMWTLLSNQTIGIFSNNNNVLNHRTVWHLASQHL